jgi:putative ABC transport system permease protein
MKLLRRLTTLPLRLRTLILKSRVEQELDEELQFHLESQVDQLISRGSSLKEARTMALKAMGGVDRQKERCREVRAGQWLALVGADVAFGWRQLMKRKVTTAAAILSLGLAIGACTSAFRLIDALFLRPMPVSHPERLYAVFRLGMGFSDGKPRVETSYEYPVFQQMRATVKNEAEVIAVSFASRTDLTYGSDQEMEKAEVQYVSGTMFGDFGQQPVLGRLLTQGDDVTPGANPYVVISYDYWAHRFGKDPNVIGRVLHMGDTAFEIVGVGPKSFTGTEPGTVTDIFLPTMMNAGVTHPDWGWIRILVMLKPGASSERVQERLRAVFETLQRERAKEFSGRPKQFFERFLSWQVRLETAAAGISNAQKDYRQPLMVLGVLVVLVLLIACANVANLMSAQAAARAGEMALRFSLGARRGRLVRLVMAESTMLGLMAAALGMLFAAWATPFVVDRIQPPGEPIRLALQPDFAVVFFGIVLTLVVTPVFGLFPALRVSKVRPAGALKGNIEPLRRRRWMYGLIAAQTAFCFVVLFLAGLFATTFARLTQQPLGFSPERVLLVDAAAQRELASAVWDQTAEVVRYIPGVVSVAQAAWPLLSGNTNNSFIAVNGEVNPELASTLAISPGWADSMKIPLLSGRDFRESDTSAEAAIVNESFATQYFGAQNPIGKKFAMQGVPGSLQVVGVVGNARYQNVREPARSVFFLPLHQTAKEGELAPIGNEMFVVRTADDEPLAMSEIVRKTITKAHPELRVTNVRTQQELIDAQTIRERLLAMLAAFFAAVALLLAGIGLYGVLSFSVLQREREFGIRIAVGAPVRNIARLIVTEVSAMLAAGAVAGVALGMASVRLVDTLLFGVKGTDPTMLAPPAAVLLAAALLAAIPAVVRAARIDPAILLRTE